MQRHPHAMLLVLLVLAAPLFGATLTLPDGSLQETENLSFNGKHLTFTTASGTESLARDQVRDISFSDRKRRTSDLATDTGDLEALRDRALGLLEKFPDSTSILVLDEAENEYRADGTNVNRYRGVIYVAKDEALGYAGVGLGFDPNRERIRVLHARSLNPDGEVHSLAPDQIKISKSPSGGVFFDQNQAMSFTIPQVVVGSLIDYCYEMEEFNPFDKNLYQGAFFFQGNDPVGDSIIRITLPKNKELFFETPNCAENLAKPIIEAKGDRVTYSWHFTDMAPIIGEPMMPPQRDILPAVFYCLQKDWTYLFNRMKPMVEKRFQLTDLVKQKVDEICEGAKNLREKIGRIYLFCQKEIRYISIKGNLASNQVGHPAEDTLRNRYGDCTDKGMLLATMLKHIGVEAYPVGIRTNDAGKAMRKLPIFDANHCITEVHLDGRVFYLDSTATDYRYPYFRADDHDTIADNPMRETLNQVPLPQPEDNAVQITRTIKLQGDGTTYIDFTSKQNGPSEASFRASARNLKPEEYERQIRSSVAALTADYILEIATHSDPLDFSQEFSARSAYFLNRYAPRSGRYMIFEIPFFRLSFPEISLLKRTYDIHYTTTRLRTEQITIELPKGFTVKYLPPPLRIQSQYIEFEVIYDLQGDTIKVTRKLAMPRRIIPAADYLPYKAHLEKIAKSTEERIFLEEAVQAGGAL